MRRTTRFLIASALFGLASPIAASSAFAAPKAGKTVKKAPAKPAPKKVVPVSAEHKKKLAELFAGFKFGMSKDEVIAVLKKQVDERYDEKIKSTTDVAAQDRFRADRKAEVARISSTFTAFEGKKTGWDVSIIEEEFAHNTGESMLERWENQQGKNQRRFYFFHEGRLWKMFISLDVSILPDDKKNFDTFSGVMQGQYGPGDIEAGRITWRTPEFDVRAVDHLRSYDALALIIEEPGKKRELIALREAKAPPKKETSNVIKAVVDPDNKDKPDVKANSNAVDAVINAQKQKK